MDSHAFMYTNTSASNEQRGWIKGPRVCTICLYLDNRIAILYTDLRFDILSTVEYWFPVDMLICPTCQHAMLAHISNKIGMLIIMS